MWNGEWGFRIKGLKRGAGRKAQGVWCHMATLSLGQDAALSLVVRGRGKLEIADCGFFNRQRASYIYAMANMKFGDYTYGKP